MNDIEKMILDAANKTWHAGDIYIGPKHDNLKRFTEEILRQLMPDEWYPGSKDWQASVWERPEWLKGMYEGRCEEVDMLYDQMAAIERSQDE